MSTLFPWLEPAAAPGWHAAISCVDPQLANDLAELFAAQLQLQKRQQGLLQKAPVSEFEELSGLLQKALRTSPAAAEVERLQQRSHQWVQEASEKGAEQHELLAHQAQWLEKAPFLLKQVSLAQDKIPPQLDFLAQQLSAAAPEDIARLSKMRVPLEQAQSALSTLHEYFTTQLQLQNPVHETLQKMADSQQAGLTRMQAQLTGQTGMLLAAVAAQQMAKPLTGLTPLALPLAVASSSSSLPALPSRESLLSRWLPASPWTAPLWQRRHWLAVEKLLKRGKGSVLTPLPGTPSAMGPLLGHAILHQLCVCDSPAIPQSFARALITEVVPTQWDSILESAAPLWRDKGLSEASLRAWTMYDKHPGLVDLFTRLLSMPGAQAARAQAATKAFDALGIDTARFGTLLPHDLEEVASKLADALPEDYRFSGEDPLRRWDRVIRSIGLAVWVPEPRRAQIIMDALVGSRTYRQEKATGPAVLSALQEAIAKFHGEERHQLVQNVLEECSAEEVAYLCGRETSSFSKYVYLNEMHRVEFPATKLQFWLQNKNYDLLESALSNDAADWEAIGRQWMETAHPLFELDLHQAKPPRMEEEYNRAIGKMRKRFGFLINEPNADGQLLLMRSNEENKWHAGLLIREGADPLALEPASGKSYADKVIESGAGLSLLGVWPRQALHSLPLNRLLPEPPSLEQALRYIDAVQNYLHDPGLRLTALRLAKDKLPLEALNAAALAQRAGSDTERMILAFMHAESLPVSPLVMRGLKTSGRCGGSQPASMLP